MARSRPKVIIVDDDSATRDGLSALLETWGYSASSAEDGKTALKLCAKELPHAIVTDLMMPGMNGIEFIQGLQEQVRQVAVVMMTGQATVETAVQAGLRGQHDRGDEARGREAGPLEDLGQQRHVRHHRGRDVVDPSRPDVRADMRGEGWSSPG